MDEIVEELCEIYLCPYNDKNLCCACCSRDNCPDRCLNIPEKCGCLKVENWRE